MSKNLLPSIDDIDDDVLNDTLLNGAQNMPSLSTKKSTEFSSPASASSHNSKSQPSRFREEVSEDDPSAQRITKAISLPRYVWEWVKEQHRENDEPQNVTIMRAMKKGGAPIRDGDLVDARKARWQNR